MRAEAEAPAEQRKKRPAAKQTGTAIIHSLWDERDEDYAPEDHATYSGNIWNLFEVSYIADGKENTFSYDARGNRISEIETYTGSNGRVTDAEYLYDYRGLCIAKTSGNETEYHEYTADGRLIYTERSDYVADYVYSGTSIFAEVRKQNGNDETFYHHTDHLGTTEVITDESGTVVWKASYEAFGSVLCENGTRVFEASFTGKFFDKDIGLYYFNARWYDAETGKFVSSDPIRDGVNWWNYCNSSPLTFIDSTGLRGKDISTNSYSEERVEKLMKKYNSFVKKARKVGYDQSANLLEHYLQGSGSTYFINSDWLQQYSQVTDAVTINIGRYEKQFKDIAENMYPGEVMQLNELPFIGKEQIGPFGKSDYSGFSSMQNAGVRGRLRGIGNDLYYTTGTFTITTFCDVTLSKNLEGEVSVVGKMTHIFWDKYDWHDNLSVYIPTVGKVKDSDAKYLEKYGPAQSFKMKSQWSLDYEKKF